MYSIDLPKSDLIIDSACCLRDYTDDPPGKTSQHGEWVFDIASFYAPEASFVNYLAAVEGDSENDSEVGIPHLAFAKAISEATDDDVDILNVSAGRARPKCTHGDCIYCSEISRAVHNDILVVASAGNNEDSPVHCPSNAEQALSVGGMEVKCTYRNRIPGAQPNKPPQAYWTRIFDGGNYPNNAATEAYCSTRGCWSQDGSCEQNKLVTGWDQNPIFSGGKPDILAPVHYAAEEDKHDNPFVWAASSFAAPVVSGCLAGVLSKIETQPSPYQLRQAVRDGGFHIGEIRVKAFDAAETYQYLSE